MNAWLATAAGLSAVTLGFHVVLGGRDAARPLLASADLGRKAKFTTYFCWHLVTIMIAALAGGFAYAAWTGAAELAVFLTMLAWLAELWSVAMIAWFRLPPLAFPQWALLVPIGLCGWIGALG